jgi:hypothetical protein
MNTLHPTFDIPIEFIENSINVGIKLAENHFTYIPSGSDLKKIYFVGASLVLDCVDEFGQTDSIIINHDSETFGSFNGGPRRLLSINAIRNLEKLMELLKIKYTPKNW